MPFRLRNAEAPRPTYSCTREWSYVSCRSSPSLKR
jgi:hypothetical protein